MRSAFTYCILCGLHTKFVIFSDSMSSLETLNDFKMELDLVFKIVKDYTNLMNAGKTIKFCWISSHVNIPGNERANSAAKAARCLHVTSMKLPACELTTRVSKFCLEKRQDIWNSATNNKLHVIYPVVGTSCHNNPTSHHEAVIINRWKFGNSRLTHSYLLSREDQPTCVSCNASLTVKHVLLDCVDLQDIRQKHFTASSLKDIFESVVKYSVYMTFNNSKKRWNNQILNYHVSNQNKNTVSGQTSPVRSMMTKSRALMKSS